MDVLRYRTPAGADPVGKYLDRLPADEAGEVESALVALEEYGFDGAESERRRLVPDIRLSEAPALVPVTPGLVHTALQGFRSREAHCP